jgi:hypothetical protein
MGFVTIVFIALLKTALAVPLVYPREIRPRMSEDSTRIQDAILTALAGLCSILLISCYIKCTHAGTSMTVTCKLPFGIVKKNIAAILVDAWPARARETPGASERHSNHLVTLFYIDDKFKARGFADGLPPCGDEHDERTLLWLSEGSETMSSLVQFFIWEWATMWLSVVMIITTLLFNGFFTSALGPDSWLRLAIVIIYAALYFAHFVYTASAFFKFLNINCQGCAWDILNRVGFRVTVHNTIPSDAGVTVFDRRNPDKSANVVHRINSEEPGHAGELDTIRETHKSISESAANTALNVILTNATIMGGIIISYGFTTWEQSLVSTDLR